ncbi:TetR/AcrR family transcriptional regulator [Brevibacterium sp. CBA3109]|uniref:TetR/AcrR family transcriptional regulator n=1 Tax=Brevibacterium koreense TaxID=3140787 RepID=A0AAU7UMA7_9MICO
MTKTEDQGEDLPTLVDAALLRDLPSTARGVRTRASLVAAARAVFERDGFIDSRLTDITKEAQCSTGTFYTYFDSKEEAFTAVLQEAQDDMLHPGPPDGNNEDRTVVESLDAGNRAYIESYKRNAKLMLLLEQVAAIDPKFRRLRLKRGRAFAERNCRWITKLQEGGFADPDLDPDMSARALSAMVGRMAYHKYALEESGWGSDDLLIENATKLWVNALGIPGDGSRRGPSAQGLRH